MIARSLLATGLLCGLIAPALAAGDPILVIGVQPETLDIRVPSLLLQPLVENSIKHGVAKKAGPGHISITARRDGDTATQTIEAGTPLVVSVTDQSGEARYPSFKGIMAAKKKPVESWSLADLGVSPDDVGLSAAWTTVESFAARPARTAGTIVVDEGDGAAKLVEFLAGQKFI